MCVFREVTFLHTSKVMQTGIENSKTESFVARVSCLPGNSFTFQNLLQFYARNLPGFRKNLPGFYMRCRSCHQPCLLLRQPLAGSALKAVPLASWHPRVVGHLERFVAALLCFLQGDSDRHFRSTNMRILPPRPMPSLSSPPVTSKLSWAAPLKL